MNLIPFEKLTVSIQQDIDFVKARLLEKSEPWQNETMRIIKDFREKRYSDPTKFELKINKEHFTLRRINDRFSHNGLRPIVKGNLKNKNSKTIINLTIRQHFTTTIGLLVWTTFTLLVAIVCLTSNPTIAITGFLFFTVGYLFFLYGYNSEIKHYKKFLQDTLNQI